MYRSLNPTAIVTTIEQLKNRITERFPDSGLTQVAGELLEVGRQSSHRVEEIRRPHLPLRIAVGLLIALLAVILGVTAKNMLHDLTAMKDTAGVIAATEPALNELIFFGALTIFLVTLERRWRRNQALRSIHELRSLAHVVDMHQLTKDPQHVFAPSDVTNTPSSPRRQLTPFELSRYLDYCSEMFSLIGKVGALFVQGFDDAAVIASVNDVDQLTTGLSRKVWQKLVILHSLEGGATPVMTGKSGGEAEGP